MSADEEIKRLRRALEEQELRLACQTDRISALLQSSSWRVTKPLRVCSGVWHRLSSKLATGRRNDYRRWCQRHERMDATARTRIRDAVNSLPRRPLLSVLMPVYNPPPEFLDQAIQSVRQQFYPDWELCLADDASTDPAVHRVMARHAAEDPRIKLIQREKNGHISAATNSALAAASGEFIALLDHDDLLAEHALFCVAQAILAHAGATLIYSDEDKITANGRRYDPYFKCELNRELLLAQNMISHLGAYRRELVLELGGFRPGLEGSQDWDLALRVVERSESNQVIHLPRILYHWRASQGSTSLAPSEKTYAATTGRRAVADHLARRGVTAEVSPAPGAADLNMVRYAQPTPQPKVSLIIPTRDGAALLRRCLESLGEKTTYQNYDVTIIDNGSIEAESLRYLESVRGERIAVLREDGPFNFSALNNLGVRQTEGEIVCLLNNDIEIVTPDWLEEMVSVALQPGVGAVGARLWYPDGGLQHGGVLLGVGGVAGHAHRQLRRGSAGYFGRAILRQEFSAVTGACLVVQRRIFLEAGGLDETLAVTGNDVDFCLRLQAAGYRNIWTPYAEMIHHESVSRGDDDTPEKHTRASMEQRVMKDRWGDLLQADPAYSLNLTLTDTNFSLAWPPRTRPL
jgi:GT2 family glycosyltransferase